MQINRLDDPYPADEAYKRQVQTSLFKGSSESGVNLVFQDKREWGELEYLTRFRKAPLYAVPTYPYNPAPYIRGVSREEAWQKLAVLLAESGVREIEVGGRYFLYEPFDLMLEDDRRVHNLISARSHLNKFAAEVIQAQLRPAGCGGLASWILLVAGFNISISEAASPTSKVELPRQRITQPIPL